MDGVKDELLGDSGTNYFHQHPCKNVRCRVERRKRAGAECLTIFTTLRRSEVIPVPQVTRLLHGNFVTIFSNAEMARSLLMAVRTSLRFEN